MSKRERLLQLIDKVSNGNKTAFANMLGISPQGLSSWISRDTYDIELIYSKCENISATWLISGEGEMFDNLKSLDEDSIRVKLANWATFISRETPVDSKRRKDIFRRLQLIAANEGKPLKDDYITTQARHGAPHEVILKWINLVLQGTKDKYSYDWILTGKGRMLLESNDEETIKTGKILPLIPYEAFAGYGTMHYPDMPIESYYTIDEFNNADFLIRVKGDSMYPKYNNGDLIACKKVKEITFWQWHKIYAICTKNQGILVKRVEQFNDNPAYITLVSENPMYRPFEIHKDEIVDVALVLGAIILE